MILVKELNSKSHSHSPLRESYSLLTVKFRYLAIVIANDPT